MNKTVITRDTDNLMMTVERRFEAPRDLVWRAYTDPEWLDRWWAPRPWRAETLHMDFAVGGHWRYAMCGPDGERHHARMDFLEIVPRDFFRCVDVFADESGNAIPDMPTQTFKTTFTGSGDATEVTVIVNYEKAEDLQKVIEMGIEQGITMAQDQLEEMLRDGTLS